ncbi:MAG: DNA repair protein RecO [Patescibacteria group bacterium]
MGLYRAEGIVLSNREIGEADRVVTLLCREQGKLEAVARGARRPRNRLVGLTLPFNLLRVSLFSGRGLDQLSQAEGIRSFQGLRDDLTRLAYASYLVELAREFLPEHEPNPGVFELLLLSLTRLEAGREPEGLTRLFELRLLDLSGFRPALDGCLLCGGPPGGEVAFSCASGGFYCGCCAREDPASLLVPGAAVTALARGLAGDDDFCQVLPPGTRAAVQRILRAFIEARLDRELRSLRFLLGVTGMREGVAGT